MDVRNGEMDVLIERISNSLWTVSHITVISLFFAEKQSFFCNRLVDKT